MTTQNYLLTRKKCEKKEANRLSLAIKWPHRGKSIVFIVNVRGRGKNEVTTIVIMKKIESKVIGIIEI
jgi:hypothetical protein